MRNKSNDKNHDRIVDLLYSLVKDDKKTYKETHDDSTINPIHIHVGREVVPYHPDIWAKTRKKNEIDIYEVWNTEDERSACSDILHAACTDNIRSLSIVCVRNPRFKDPWTVKYAKTICRVFLDHLRNKSGALLLEITEVYFAEIGKDDIKDDNKIKRSLKAQLDF